MQRCEVKQVADLLQNERDNFGELLYEKSNNLGKLFYTVTQLTKLSAIRQKPDSFIKMKLDP